MLLRNVTVRVIPGPSEPQIPQVSWIAQRGDDKTGICGSDGPGITWAVTLRNSIHRRYLGIHQDKY